VKPPVVRLEFELREPDLLKGVRRKLPRGGGKEREEMIHDQI
jgi:hypothetical protein